MKHSIWHNKSETPPASTSAIVDNGTHSYYGPTGWSVTPQQRWAKIDDLLTCEKELIRTRQALSVATDALQWIDETYSFGLGYESPIKEKIEYALNQINQIIGGK